MEAFLAIGVLVLVFGSLWAAERAGRTWRDAAAALGLKFDPGSAFTRARIHGQLGRFAVEVTRFVPLPFSADIRISGRGAIPGDITLVKRGSPEPSWSLRGDGRRPDTRTIGDPELDAAVRIQGNEGVLRAFLDWDTREVVAREVGRAGVEVIDAGLHGALKCEAFRNVTSVVGRVNEMLELARRLDLNGETVASRLARSLAAEPIAGVKLAGLHVLQEQFPGSPETREASRGALAHPSEAVQMQGATFLGPEGLERVTRLTESERAPPDVRVQGIEHLVAHAGWGEAAKLLSRLLVAREPPVRRAAVRGLGSLRCAAASTQLAALGADEQDTETAAAFATALGEIGGEAAEPALLRFLARPELDVKEAAAAALGRCGSATAVEPLLAYTKGLLTEPTLKSVSRLAIGAIQSRLTGAETGRLTVVAAGAEEGALSLSDPDRGALTISDADRADIDAARPREDQDRSRS